MQPPRFHTAFVPHDLRAPFRGAKAGPLAGLSAAVKDMFDIAGTRTGGGSPDWRSAHPPAQSNAAAVRNILDASAVIIGKTICDEFFYSITGANAHYGTPVNPRAPGRLPGGSSSGSAAAVASGACDFALGGDTGGSVRVPASLCGIYGIRPTHGRVDLSGAMAMAPSFDVAGWFAGGPGVCRAVGAVLLCGPPSRGTIQNLMILDDAFAEADAEVAVLLRSALDEMAADLPEPICARAAPDGLDSWRECFRIIQAREVWLTFGPFIEKHKPKLGPGIRERMEFAARVVEHDAEKARQARSIASERIRGLAKPGTILCIPTAPSIAPLLTASEQELDSFRLRVMRLTCIAGLSGLPQITIPAGTVSGCPAGLSFIGWEGADEVLLDLAFALSRHCGAQG
ncbi:MAG: amidase [Beijerinckiaceae bacterium]|nr:amidase [Beijerinckiaceae bacterium]